MRRPFSCDALPRSIALPLSLLAALALASGFWGGLPRATAAEPAEEIIPLAAWRSPPQDALPVARWWWPGGSVDPKVMRAQLAEIKAAGFGAVEVQPLLLGLGEDDIAADDQLRTVGTPGFRRLVEAAASAAADVGLAFDFTLGSGWPGGLPTPKIASERQLVMGTLDLVGPSRFEGALPSPPDQSYRGAVEWVLDVLGPQDSDATLVAVLAARLGPGREGIPTLEGVEVLTAALTGGRLEWDVPEGKWRIFACYENSTGHFVMGGAFPGAEEDALVVDHLSVLGADALIEGYAEPMLAGLAPGSVREVFIDSFELMGELPATGELLSAFRRSAGYDLTPHLPLLFRRGGESKYAEMLDLFGRSGGPVYLLPEAMRAERIREDYEAVRAELFLERYVERFVQWSRRRGLALRLQAHGGYADYLDSYARSDIPEAEALFGAGSFDFLKLAASAAHVADRRWASSESFITLRLFGTQLTREEMVLLAGRAYSAGINRLAFHGVPYPAKRADGVDWYPFSGGFGRILAGPLPMSSRIDSALLAELPDFNSFLARMSVAMSAGEPVADVAWLRSDGAYPDAPSFQLGHVEPRAGESAETAALRARGLVHDRVSRRMLAGATLSAARQVQIGARRYGAVLLDPLAVAAPELVERIATLAEAGVPVVALGELPGRAPGLRDAAARDRRVTAAVRRLEKHVVSVRDAVRLESALQQRVRSTLVEPPVGKGLAVSLDRRRSSAGDTLLVFNESWSPVEESLVFVHAGGPLEVWDPVDGSRRVLRERVAAGDPVSISLEPAQSLILTLRRSK